MAQPIDNVVRYALIFPPLLSSKNAKYSRSMRTFRYESVTSFDNVTS